MLELSLKDCTLVFCVLVMLAVLYFLYTTSDRYIIFNVNVNMASTIREISKQT